uniref:Uncharacterized protein n=1 Tax=Avena sativa TaxID=4498 RepID=A0ACD5ZDY9_AVESA
MAPEDDKASPSPPSRPALPGGAEEYVRDSISFSLGLPVPDRSLRLKLLASEDLRRRLQDHVFALEEDLYAAARRIDLLKKESAMNAEGIRRCVEEKEAVAAARDRLEKEVTLYERDLERAMESCDDLARENEDLRTRLKDNPDLAALNNEVQALQRDREILKTNLNKAEEEVKLLFEENRALDEANKRLLEKEQKHRSERKQSASNSTKKRKSSSLKDTSPVSLAIDFNSVEASRNPLSPLQQNSPDCRVHKK